MKTSCARQNHLCRLLMGERGGNFCSCSCVSTDLQEFLGGRGGGRVCTDPYIPVVSLEPLWSYSFIYTYPLMFFFSPLFVTVLSQAGALHRLERAAPYPCNNLVSLTLQKY